MEDTNTIPAKRILITNNYKNNSRNETRNTTRKYYPPTTK